MQGHTATSAGAGQTRSRFFSVYGRTMIGITLPAMVAGLVTALFFHNAKGTVEPMHDLAQRVEMIRYAQTKVASVEAVRGASIHAPVEDVASFDATRDEARAN
jgi:hypothetical protein